MKERHIFQPELPPERESSHAFSPKCQLPLMLWEDNSSWRMRIFSGGESKVRVQWKEQGPFETCKHPLYPSNYRSIGLFPSRRAGGTGWNSPPCPGAATNPGIWLVLLEIGFKSNTDSPVSQNFKLPHHPFTYTDCMLKWHSDYIKWKNIKIHLYLFLVIFFNEVARQFKIIHVPGILFLECQDGTGIENSGLFGESVLKANDTEDI